ncbi:helix-turn-helix transcriptional regulator [Bacillus massiliglaciei]|uniref:helix-turn-helix transcriptional regulator n=1 Tax=Bacillus massiliglaciei TaxID=1816693 RepID=UPI000DA62DA8|nr:helix-turn-helix transcriptional regulator [Bacillus massiliglaciei]
MTEKGLGKPRSKFGKFIDINSISQKVLADQSGVSKSTISRLCQQGDYTPNMKNGIRLVKVLNEAGYKVSYEDFWGV